MNCTDQCRPCLDKEDVIEFIESYIGDKVHSAEELESYEDRNYCISYEENKDCKNVDSSIIRSTKHIVKVVGYCETSIIKWKSLKLIMAYLQEKGFYCTQILSIPDSQLEKNGSVYQPLILNYLKGQDLMKCWSYLDKAQVFGDTGQMVAQLHDTLEKMDLSMLTEETDPEDPWKLENTRYLMDYTEDLENEEEKDVIRSIVVSFVASVETVQTHLTKGIIHGDLHDMNLIVNCKDGQLQPLDNISLQNDNVKQLFGIIDFEDISVSYYIFEVSQVIRDFMVSTQPENCYSVAVCFLTGYLKKRKLNQSELKILFISIMAALCQYYVMGEYEFKKQPNNEYCKTGSQVALELIFRFHNCQQLFLSNLTKCFKEEYLIDVVNSQK